MPTLTLSIASNGLGSSINNSVTRTGDGGSASEIAVPAGKAGTMGTKTDADTGELSMDTGHGLSNGLVVDVFWATGGRYGMDTSLLSGDLITVDGGSGDDLPADTTALVASVRTYFNALIDGDELGLLVMQNFYAISSTTNKSHVSLLDVALTEVAGVTLTGRNARSWDITGGDTNAFTGLPITHGYASNGSATDTSTLKIIWVQDTTP